MNNKSFEEKKVNRKRSVAMKGRTSPRKNAILTDETKLKMSLAKLGIPKSVSHKENMRKPHKKYTFIKRKQKK